MHQAFLKRKEQGQSCHLLSSPRTINTLPRHTANSRWSPTMVGENNPSHRWWLTNRMIAEKYVREARMLVTTQAAADITAGLRLLESALAVVPRLESALELKARCLLFLRRWREVAEMLKEHIPSYRAGAGAAGSDEGDSFTSTSSDGSDAHRAKLLPDREERSDGDRGFRCFSVADLKRKVLAGLCRSSEEEGHWRYLLLGHACYHLGLMDDAMVLLQTGRRLAGAAFRQESTSISDDNFTFSTTTTMSAPSSSTQLQAEIDSAVNLLSHIKILVRRRQAAISALDASHPTEAIRHFSKILDGHRGTPHHFAVDCLVGRATAHQSAGRPAEAIADLNRALALDPAHIPALRARADLLQHVRNLNDCLRDLDHLKLLYDTILRKPTWRPNNDVSYRSIPVNLRTLTHRIQEVRLTAAAGSGCVDYYRLLGVRRGCSRAELARAHLLLNLRHRPEKAAAFVDRLEFTDDHRGIDAVREQARMSALMLYRMLQKGYSSIMSAVMDDEAAERQRARDATAAAAVTTAAVRVAGNLKHEKLSDFQGVFCRDVAAVGSMISAVGFSQGIPVK